MRQSRINHFASHVLLAGILLSGCSPGDGLVLEPPPAGAGNSSYYVGGTISGLSGAGLVLRNNGTDDLAIAANGVFFFATPQSTGSAFAITVHSQPSGQLCTVASGSGTVGTSNALSSTVSCLSRPAAPTLTLGYAIKQLQFSWATVTGATHYKLYQDPDGVSGYTQVGSDLAAGTTQYLHDIAVHRHHWAGARYLLEACNAAGCTASANVNTAGAVLQAIGYFKASNTAASDNLGYAIALSADGNTLAVGAYGEDSNATGIGGNQSDNSASEAGAVYVFGRSAGAWSQQAYVKASNTAAGDRFGFSLALSTDGGTLAVGAYQEDSNATGIGGNQANNSASNAGAVYVFTRSGTTWSQQAYVKASNTGASDNFGFAVALSGDGNTLAVGAHNEDSNATGINGNQANNSIGGSGAVYVFARSGTVWSQESYVKASNPGGNDNFGYRVALNGDGNTLAVGAYREDSNATGIGGNQADNSAADAGAVYVFTRVTGVWAQQAYAKASNTGAGDYFGISLALSSDGDTLAVGAQREDSNATGIDGNQANNSASNAGAAYVFTRNAGAWSQQAYVKPSNTQASDSFGYSLALSADGNTLAVGAYQEDSNASAVGGDGTNNGSVDAGAVYTFARASGAWSQQAYVKASNTAGGDYFGFALGLSTDGGTLAISGHGEDSNALGIGGTQSNNAASAAGAVYLY